MSIQMEQRSGSIADLVAFLATPASAKVTGQSNSVKGGISAA
jgi:hypothetical protein